MAEARPSLNHSGQTTDGELMQGYYESDKCRKYTLTLKMKSGALVSVLQELTREQLAGDRHPARS